MKIRSVEAFLLSAPLPEPLVLPYHGGERTIVKRDAMLICVEGNHGFRGYGPGPAHEDALAAIRGFIAPSPSREDVLSRKGVKPQGDGRSHEKTQERPEVQDHSLSPWPGSPVDVHHCP